MRLAPALAALALGLTACATTRDHLARASDPLASAAELAELEERHGTLQERGSYEILLALVRNPALPVERLRRHARGTSDQLVVEAAKNPSLPAEDLVDIAFGTGPERCKHVNALTLQVAVASNPSAPPSLLARLAELPAADVVLPLANNPSTPGAFFEGLAQRETIPREALAGILTNPNTPERIRRWALLLGLPQAERFQRLGATKDADPWLRAEVILMRTDRLDDWSRAATPRRAYELYWETYYAANGDWWAKDPDPEVQRLGRLGCGSASPEAVQAALAGPSWPVRALVAGWPANRPEVLAALAGDPVSKVRRLVARHTRDQALLARLLDDPDQEVRVWALMNPAVAAQVLDARFEKASYRERLAIAGNPGAGAGVYGSILASRDRTLAEEYFVSGSFEHVVARGGQKPVSQAVLEMIPEARQRALVGGTSRPGGEVLVALARHTSYPSVRDAILATTDAPEVARDWVRLRGHGVDEAALRALARSTSPHVRAEVAYHPATSEELLRQLEKDRDSLVSGAALVNLGMRADERERVQREKERAAEEARLAAEQQRLRHAQLERERPGDLARIRELRARIDAFAGQAWGSFFSGTLWQFTEKGATERIGSTTYQTWRFSAAQQEAAHRNARAWGEVERLREQLAGAEQAFLEKYGRPPP